MGRVLFALIGKADLRAAGIPTRSAFRKTRLGEEDIGPTARAARNTGKNGDSYKAIHLFNDFDQDQEISNSYKAWLAEKLGCDESTIRMHDIEKPSPFSEQHYFDAISKELQGLPDGKGDDDWNFLISSGFPQMRPIWEQFAYLFRAKITQTSMEEGAKTETHAVLPAYAEPVPEGLYPVLYVFDAYNNYVVRGAGNYSVGDSPTIELASEFFSAGIDRIEIALVNHCRMLNDLGSVFEVRTPRVWMNSGEAGVYSQVLNALSVTALDKERTGIAAFILALDWGGVEGDPKVCGVPALQILSRRYPEIPVFIRTGDWQLQKLQEGFANGAEWCFRKWATHHQFFSAAEGEPLDIPGLQQHLISAAQSRYQAFGETPYPDQLQLLDEVAVQLLDQMSIRLPLKNSVRGRELQKLIATLFPGGDVVRPVKLFGSGKSKAQGTFVVRPSRNGILFAPRFLKVAPWLEIQREYLAYQNVIRPRLGSYVANIIERPVMAGGEEGESPMGALVYSLAGLPEGYEDLKPLDEMLKAVRNGTADTSKVKTRLLETLKHVLLPLYGAMGGKPGMKKRPLWDWFGEVLPPTFTGTLVPLKDSDSSTRKSDATVKSRKLGGLKDSTAWLMAARDTADLRDKTCSGEISPWNLGKAACITLSGFILLEAAWGNDSDTGEITLAHPDLGWRIRLRGKADDIRRRFGAIWARPGMPVDVVVCIEKKNRETEKIEQKLQASFTSVGIKKKNSSWLTLFEKAADREGLPNPFDLFGENGMPFSFTIPAHEAPIHGDLNLHNILFSGDSGPGWLIDFDRANLHGMPAFDLAKLEAEIWHHHLFPALKDIASGAKGKNEVCLKLLNAALTAADAEFPGEMFTSLVRTKEIVSGAKDGLLLPVCNLLAVISVAREFGRNKLKLDDAECRWALAAYLFTAAKFAGGDDPWRSILSFFASAWHLSEVAPDLATRHDTVFDSLKGGDLKAAEPRKVDGLLIAMTKAPSGLDEFTREMAEFRNVPVIVWEKGTKRWDLASTGSITNITPIFGYLWLMVKAQQSRENGVYKVVVPKISSKGASCGTVDVLEAGGLSFPSDPEAIKAACTSKGGVLCEQHKDLTPVDKALMKRRRETNTMKNVALVYASILSKKIAVGCTDAIVDVKVGRDSKILAPWMDKGQHETWLGLDKNSDRKLCPDMADSFMKILKSEKMLGEDALVTADSGKPWVVHDCKGKLGDLDEVRWFFTNSDMPQCRTIGRQLTLLHLDDLILGTHGETLLDGATSGDSEKNEYYKLYRDVLPKVCEVSGELWEDVKKQWKRLKEQMPRMQGFVIEDFFKDKQSKTGLLAKGAFEKGIELVEGMDLRVMTLALSPYQLSAKKEQKVKRIKAWELDAFFDWLSEKDNYDPEVGIYLHRLPGEKIDSPSDDPFISIFFRPSWTPEADVLARARAFLSEHVELGENT